jgi:uncharacterized repeat protein (TIGR01451 family)
MTGRTRNVRGLVLALAVASICTPLCWSASAFAFGEGPGWMLTANSYPTNMEPGGKGAIVVNVMNIGAGASTGTVTVTDTLPPGVTAIAAGASEGFGLLGGSGEVQIESSAFWECTGNGPGAAPAVTGASVVTCRSEPAFLSSIAGGGGNPGDTERPYPDPSVAIKVKLPEGETSGINHATIEGGGAPTSASTSNPVTVTSKPAPFGFAGWKVWFSNADGTLDTQAGSHPYETTFSYDLNNTFSNLDGYTAAGGGAGPLPEILENRNLEVKLPPGFVGDPYAVPFCTRPELDGERCPASSQVGILSATIVGGILSRFNVYNVVPPAGVPDEIGFTLSGIGTRLDTGVRSGGDYGLTTHVHNIPERSVISSTLTLWGVPGEHSHAIWRKTNYGVGVGLGGCAEEEIGTATCPTVNGQAKPFLTLPTSCSAEPLKFSIWGDTWENPGITAERSIELQDSNGAPSELTGCERLGFGPVFTTSPDTAKADTPSGLTVEVNPPVGGLSNPTTLSTADIQNTTVTLPEGMVINPGQAAGLQACQETEATLKENDEAPVCPSASKVGTDEIETPLLAKPLQGSVYIMQANPPDLQLLVAASGEGVNLKLVGHVHLDGTSGRLVTTFSNTPELPFTSFRLAFSGGAQAALATPTTCGTYMTTSDFSPWASPFVSDVFPTAAFNITSGANGAPCPSSPLPFGPSLIAGSTTDQAGGFTDFSLLLQAPDDQQRIEKLQFKVPEGLLGMISKVALCPEPQAQDGTCSPASQIGHTVVASGPGPYPLVVPQPGQPPAAIYLTGAYKGAPYGLSIVVPVVAGPFTLQTQIVRARIEIDPLTAQITVTTDPFPQIIDGIPTDLRTINAVIDRPGFMFNPTSCQPMSFSGTAFSAQGASTPISSPFQMGSCQSLKFKPDFRVSTAGKTSRKNGASLDVKLIYPPTPLGANQASSQSNIKSVKVDLPRQLPSRLTTLQKACPSATFEANPANCQAASRVGQVAAVTPVLPVALTGPAYFVSYGGAKFPELVFVLQGYGVTVYVHAETFINKAGITSSTLHRVPDVPISSFELKLPQGPFSALAANGNLCTSTLKMPTAFTAQNGAVIHQSTPIGVTGCPKHKTNKASKRTTKRKRKK